MNNFILDSYYRYKAEKKIYQNYCVQKARNSGMIQYYNWWELDVFDGVWLQHLLQSDEALLGGDKTVSLISVFGNRNIVKHIKSDIKVFCTGENVKKRQYLSYSDHLLNEPSIDLALGFEYFESKRYMRFPLWLMYAFNPCFNENEIKARCGQLRYPIVGNRTAFASLVASHDDELHIRSSMYESLSKIGKVNCPGRFNHNDDTLRSVFGDKKTDYLRQFSFNICPENANAMGYVTEKLFEAIASGCIPLYWGSYNHPEPDVLNPEAIIFWDPEGDNSKALQLIEDLFVHPTMMEEFLHQPRLLPSAEENVCEFFSNFHERFSEIMRK